MARIEALPPTVDQIATDNPDLLLIGQQLVIPPQDGVLYTVRPGDRLSDVAERYGVDKKAIYD